MQLNLEDHRVVSPIPTIHLVREYITPEEESYLVRKIDQVGNANAVVQPDLSLSVRAGGWQRVNGRRSMYWGGTLTPKGKLLPQTPPSFMTEEWPHVFRRLQQLDIFSSSSSSSSSSVVAQPPNHCLVNEYHPGDGILPHLDGPAYLPTVATISLESDTVYEFYCQADRYGWFLGRLAGADTGDDEGATLGEDMEVKEEAAGPIAPEPLFSLFVPRRSLLVLRHQAYSLLLHSIPARPIDLLHSHLLPCLNSHSFFSPPYLPSHLVSLPRARRISLTCRRVQRVVHGLHQFLK
ncbi:hypothetical protein VP01_68g15 [Puccinia sorghi]|uniref:Fe2OG dioxygenase domain-containing protein n=1 Tax=Puccinia sorghi TaxID=27349 RepID=A0A0L6UE91_9BASI|nr:hypothetical protein VP01_68g15 [Puccinia sorghi]